MGKELTYNLELLVQGIKQKKELQSIDAAFVREQLFIYFKEKPAAEKILQSEINLRSAAYKKIIKEMRARLRRTHGLFRSAAKIKPLRPLVESLAGTSSAQKTKIITVLLQGHASTRERIPFYRELYRKIFTLTGQPKTILDLGCGLNPFSIPQMQLKKLTYHAYDVDEQEVNLLNTFFQQLGIDGKAAVLDIANPALLTALPQADMALMFKLTDILDKGKNHKFSEAVIRAIPARFVVVSFPTITMSGKPMNFPRRKWIELMSTRLGYTYDILPFPTEIFYVIRKE